MTLSPDLVYTLTPLPVLIPMFAAAVTLFAGRQPAAAAAITLAALSRWSRCARCCSTSPTATARIALQVGGWGPRTRHGPLGITLVVDRLSALMLVVSSIVLLAVVFYAIGQGIRDGDERQPVSIFLPTYLALSAGVCNAFLAGDLFNLFVGFEVLLAAQLRAADHRREQRPRPRRHLLRDGVDGVVADLPVRHRARLRRDGHAEHGRAGGPARRRPAGTRSALFAVLLVAFGIKAAVFPLSTWLPDSYPTAPAPVTAVFAGLLTKVGVYAIIRAHTLLFPGGGLDRHADGRGAAHHARRHPRRDRAERHQTAAVVHPGQPHRLHGVRHRAVQRAGAVGRDLLRRPPHSRADHAVPRRRPDRTPGGRVDAAAPRRAGGGQPAAGVRVPGARRSISVASRRSPDSSARWRCWRPAPSTARVLAWMLVAAAAC